MKSAFDEKKFKVEYNKYEKARQLSEKYLFDTEYVISIIDILKDRGVLTIEEGYENDPQVWNNDLECYTPNYAMYIWRECALPALGYSYKEYKTFGEIIKSLKSLNKL